MRCRVTREVARERYRGRVRDPRHLGARREDDELWGSEVAPLGLGPLLEVHTNGPVDMPAVAAAIRALLAQ